jgi:hypothetical protein
MVKIMERVRRTIPWIAPVIEYLDWKKSVIAAAGPIIIGVWSIVKELPWPTIITIVFCMFVNSLYLVYLPAFIRIIHSGVRTKPNHEIWKYKRQFQLYEAACLLADTKPTSPFSNMDGIHALGILD